MHYPGMDQGFHAWQFVYALLMLWSAGIGTFFLIATSTDSMSILQRLEQTVLGKCVAVWVGLCLLATSIAWPVLIFAPIWSIQTFNMPVIAAIISISYTCFIIVLSGKLVLSRFSSIPIPR